MNERYLPVIASIFILALVATSFLPVVTAAALTARAAPVLVIKSIPEDDELRKTGIIMLDRRAPVLPVVVELLANLPVVVLAAKVLVGPQVNRRAAVLPVGWVGNVNPMQDLNVLLLQWLGRTTRQQDLLAQYKILVSYNGVPVAPTTIACQIVEKDKVNPVKTSQGTWENLKTFLVDQTGNFVCKFRWGKPGVGVLDLYYKGAIRPEFIADYVVNIYATLAIGRSIVYGAEIQDVCVLGWTFRTDVDPNGDVVTVTKPDGTVHYAFPDPLMGWASCEEATFYQRHIVLGLPIPWA